jgi:hydroxymethylpyrimidine/phosphomethylpyrimidine kinase
MESRSHSYLPTDKNCIGLTMNNFSSVLSIAGVDPSGGAGIFADFRAIEAAGVRALGCVTALTVQTEDSFSTYEATSIKLVRQTIQSMLKAFPDSAIKTGMIPSAEMVKAVAEELDAAGKRDVVIDPVIIASVGARLVDEGVEAAIRDFLIPRASLVTPNMHEASALTGVEVNSVTSMERAGRELLKLGSKAAVVTGGHLEGDALDILVTEKGVEHISAERLPGSVHGTGCSFASSLAAHLALGKEVPNSVKGAKKFVESLFIQQRWRAGQ